MVLLETAVNAVDVATVVAGRLPESLSPAAKTLFTALVGAAVETGRGRGYSPHTTHVTMHLPLEVLADVCGIHRVTAWRHLPALRELGLIDYRPHKSTLRGETRNSGMLWQVRLNPVAGSRARLSYDDMKHKWRDLDKDVRRKRTAHRQLKQHRATVSKTPLAKLDISRLTAWTLKPDTSQTPLFSDSCKPKNAVLEALLDVRSARGGRDTVQMVDTAARALATALADHGSTDFYRLLLWRCLRLSQQGTDLFQVVYQMAIRVQRSDIAEGFARRGGALFVSRLKQTRFWDEILQT